MSISTWLFSAPAPKMEEESDKTSDGAVKEPTPVSVRAVSAFRSNDPAKVVGKASVTLPKQTTKIT